MQIDRFSKSSFFAAGMLFTFALLGLLTPAFLRLDSAAAAGCDGSDYGQKGTVEDPSATVSNDSRGTRSNMAVYAGPTSCQRILSVYVFSNDKRGFMEFGWVIGRSNCDHQTYSRPTLFYWWSKTNRDHGCGVFSGSHPADNQYDVFQVSDANANSYWGADFNGIELLPSGIDLDFSKGWSVAGVERGLATDSGAAKWDELEEYHDGSPGDHWTFWDNARPAALLPDDPDYHLVRSDAHTVGSVHD